MAPKPVMVRIAFYKGKPDFLDRLIRLFGFGRYSRVEVAVGRRLATGWHCYAPRDEGFSRKLIDLKPDDWDIVEVPGYSRAEAIRWFKGRTERLSRIREFGFPVLRRSGVSGTAEAAADFLGFEDPQSYTPTVLHIALVSDL